jgi:hypothetical protein
MALPLPRRFSSQSHSPLRPVIIGIILTCRGDEAVVRHFIDDDLWFLGAPHPRVGHRENGFSYPFPKPAGAWQCSAPDHWHLMPSELESRALPLASRSLVGSSITKRVGKPVLRWLRACSCSPHPRPRNRDDFSARRPGDLRHGCHPISNIQDPRSKIQDPLPTYSSCSMALSSTKRSFHSSCRGLSSSLFFETLRRTTSTSFA